VLSILEVLARGISMTMYIALMSFLVGSVLAVPLACLLRSRRRFLAVPTVALTMVLKAVPPLVWLFLVFYVFGTEVATLSPNQAAILGLGSISGAYLADVYRGGLEGVPRGQWEAAAALGLVGPALYLRVVLPQALRLILGPSSTFFLTLIKDTAMVSLIGVVEITFLAFQQTRIDYQSLAIFGTAGLLYLALGLPFAVAARYLDARLPQEVTR
jgi:polar amino acid transport system permease protein